MTGGFGCKFNRSLQYALNGTKIVLVGFNYPNQFLRPFVGLQPIWSNYTNGKFTQNVATITSHLFEVTLLETLMRRNTKQKPCSTEWNLYDELVMKQHLENTGCRAPYQTMFKSLPICGTKDEMRKTHYDELGQDSTYIKPPCQEMSYIDYKHLHWSQ